LADYITNCYKRPLLIESNQNSSADSRMASGWTIVLDVGKSLSKLTLWNEAGVLVAHRSRQNRRSAGGGDPDLDAAGIEQWLEFVFKEFAALGPVSAIVPVAHGAGLALIDDDGLRCAPLDYEWAGVAADRGAYDAQRDEFAGTGSPALPAGLNLGMQLHWLESNRPREHRGALLLPWAQYWAWNLSGVAASELTSLGCHSDLWRPFDRRPSNLAVRRGWADRLAPLQRADRVLGSLRREWLRRTGLSAGVSVHCGLHDSNAALLAARRLEGMAGRDVTVLSTGTWFVAMRSAPANGAASADTLSETRDCLVNVDADGTPVPSARFMGGREIDVLVGEEHDDAPDPDGAKESEYAIRAVEAGEHILPSAVPGTGPYPKALRATPGPVSDIDEARAKAHLYAALVADASLDLIGSRDTLLVDGRFARCRVFVSALAALRPHTTVLVSDEEHGVAVGALRLANPGVEASAPVRPIAPLPVDLSTYRNRWREAAEFSK
jgi:sugar (pentulose or hexulose) kinase